MRNKTYEEAKKARVEAWKAVEATPEYEAHEEAEKALEKAEKAMKATPAWKAWEEACEAWEAACKAEDKGLAAIIATPGHKTLVKTWRERQASWEAHVKENKAYEEAEEGLNNGK